MVTSHDGPFRSRLVTPATTLVGHGFLIGLADTKAKQCSWFRNEDREPARNCRVGVSQLGVSLLGVSLLGRLYTRRISPWLMQADLEGFGDWYSTISG